MAFYCKWEESEDGKKKENEYLMTMLFRFPSIWNHFVSFYPFIDEKMALFQNIGNTQNMCDDLINKTS